MLPLDIEEGTTSQFLGASLNKLLSIEPLANNTWTAVPVGVLNPAPLNTPLLLTSPTDVLPNTTWLFEVGKASYPRLVVFVYWVGVSPLPAPRAVLKLPVLLFRAFIPIAVFKFPTELTARLPEPTDVLFIPVVMFNEEELPTAVLFTPLVQ